jgi:23S rRNA pseudouridine2605 synthase
MQACRLNRFLASRGVASRRACDDIIRAGRVRVNGEAVLLPGTRVMPGKDVVDVDGCPLAGEPEPKYIVLNKPAGVIVTAKDTRKRKTVTELLPSPLGRVFPVGRLDLNTEGLLLLTNDGSLAFRLMHPSYGVEKTYEVLVKERPDEVAVKALREGVEFGEGLRSSPARVAYVGFREEGRRERGEVTGCHAKRACVRDGQAEHWKMKGGRVKSAGVRAEHVRGKRAKGASLRGGHLIRLTICEGKKRQVRRMCKAVGLTVVSLVRTGFGPLKLGDLRTGSWRELTGAELKALMACANEKTEWSNQ